MFFCKKIVKSEMNAFAPTHQSAQQRFGHLHMNQCCIFHISSLQRPPRPRFNVGGDRKSDISEQIDQTFSVMSRKIVNAPSPTLNRGRGDRNVARE